MSTRALGTSFALVISFVALGLTGGCSAEAGDEAPTGEPRSLEHTTQAGNPPPPPPGLIDMSQTCTTLYEPYNGFFCEDSSCATGTKDEDRFNEFEFEMYSAKCRAGGNPSVNGAPNGVRDIVSYFNPEPKALDLWVYSVCDIDSTAALKAVDVYSTISPVNSKITGYCYTDGTYDTSPTKTVTRYDRYRRPYTVVMTASAFVEIHDPRCYTCVGQPIEPPPPAN